MLDRKILDGHILSVQKIAQWFFLKRIMLKTSRYYAEVTGKGYILDVIFQKCGRLDQNKKNVKIFTGM